MFTPKQSIHARVFSLPKTESTLYKVDLGMNSRGAKIFEAAENDDLETVKLMIESGGVSPSIRKQFPDETLAQVAIKRGNLGMLKYLLEKDSSLLKTNCENNRVSYDCLTLLEEAVTRGYLDIVKYLVEVHNENIMKEHRIWFQVRTPMHLAVIEGHLNIVRYFIEERHVDPDPYQPSETFQIFNSEPLLFAAVRMKQHNITTYLIKERGVDLTAVNYEKQNVLFLAVSNGDLDFVKNVLDIKKAKIDINWRDKKGKTLVYVTVVHNQIDVLRYLVEQKKADVNIPDGDNQRTPLLEAIISSKVEAFEYLVDHGADLERRDMDGRTALHLAANNNEFCKHLLEHGANVKSKDNQGETPLHVAMAEKNLKASKCLIDFSGNVNEKNDDGETLLHIVAASGEKKLVVYLVKEKHAQVNVTRKKDRWTPLHCAALWGHREICKYLIEQGANPRAKDKMKRNPAQVTSDKALIDYIQKAAKVRSRRSVDHSFWIPAQPSLPNSRTHLLTGGQHVEEIISANEVNAFHIHSALAFTDFMIRCLIPSSVHTRRAETNDGLAWNMENLPNSVVHIAEDAAQALLDFQDVEEVA